MSQAEKLLELFHVYGGKMTLGQILSNWESIGSKYTNRISELRDMGYEIECVENKERPTENLYIIKKKPVKHPIYTNNANLF